MKDDKHSKTNGYGDADCTGTGNGIGMVNLPFQFAHKSEINPGFADGKCDFGFKGVGTTYEVIIFEYGI